MAFQRDSAPQQRRTQACRDSRGCVVVVVFVWWVGNGEEKELLESRDTENGETSPIRRTKGARANNHLILAVMQPDHSRSCCQSSLLFFVRLFVCLF